MMRKAMVIGLVLLAVVMLPGERAQALINPNFTPVNLVSQSETILEISIAPPKESIAAASVTVSVKGTFSAKTITLNLQNLAVKEKALEVERLVKECAGAPALFFIGKINEKGRCLVSTGR